MKELYYSRIIDKYLINWKEDIYHKPLLLRGARQVGKSSAVKHLGKSFRYYLEVNFERDSSISSLFKGDIKPKTICSRLSGIYGVPVISGETLIFFDEIQKCPEALRSLWFFYEDYRELHIIAAGSLLEFALKGLESYGVARIHSLFMYPMSFDEFLVATNQEFWISEKNGSSFTNPLYEGLHTKLVDSFRTFLLVGGMPEVVSMWVKTNDFLRCQRIQNDILITYEDDFSKYKERVDAVLLKQTLHSVCKQIGSKFVFSDVIGDYRTEKVKEALSLLKDAGLIIPVIYTASNGLPLGSEINNKFIKYNYLDSGLLLRMLGLDSINTQLDLSKNILLSSASDLVNKGSITEMVVGLELLKYDTAEKKQCLYYWQNLSRNAQAELDYIVVKDMKILPIEVKSGTSGSMKSLYQFLEQKKIEKGLRISFENFAQINKVDILPLYAISNMFNSL